MAEAATQPAEAAVGTDPRSEAKKKKKDAHPRDPAREVVETIVFVVVLVLLLKLFVTEAFVIPTGSMAETLYGYQKMITCPECGQTFPVNSHDEVEGNPQTGRKHRLLGFCCPNCRFRGAVADLNPVPQNRTGDRVLVLKPIYHLRQPQRGDVVVFKFPKEPQQKHTAQNYIKRAMAFGGETAAIHRGELFITRSLEYPADALDAAGNHLYPRPDHPNDLWELPYTYMNSEKAEALFAASRQAGFPDSSDGFAIVRKTDEQVLADARIVWDNDHQPRALKNLPARWYAPPDSKDEWTADNAQQPRAFAHKGAGFHWIRYRHLVWVAEPNNSLRRWTWEGEQPTVVPVPGPVDNFLAYNAGVSEGLAGRESSSDSAWVGDLILECEAELGGDDAEVVIELSRGVNRFQARFAGGHVSLTMIGRGAKDFGSRPCKVSGPGKYKIRFANVDCRLRVWVDDKAIDFGTDADYQPNEPGLGDNADPDGWVKANDVDAPASVGAKGVVTIRSIKLHRDIYYTYSRGGIDHSRAEIYYVQPGHYLCLGDNSAQSSDSRSWGVVPERLMLGKAVFVFFPVGRLGFIK